VKVPRFAALQHRDFLLLWGGMGVSQLGTQVQRVAIAWQLYLLTKSPMSLGLLGLFRVLPVLLFALGAGVVADAVDRRRLMIVTQTIIALCSVALAALTITHRMSATAIYALSFLAGCANAFDNPARQSLVPSLVPREHLTNALSLNIMTWQIASVAGPGLGGLVLQASGPAAAYVLDAISFLGVIVAALAMRHRHVPAPGRRVSAAAALDGLRFVRGQPVLLWMMLLDFFGTLLAGATLLMPIFADEILHVGARGLGWLYAAPSVGAVLTALAMAGRPEVEARGAVVLASVFVYGLAIAGFGVSENLWLSLALLALSGAADTVSMVVRQTVRQVLTPDPMRGRMTGVNMIFFAGGPQLGEVEAGAVARLVGAPLSVATGGLGCALLAAAVALLMPSLRRHRA